MSYDPEREPTEDQMTEFFSRLYDDLSTPEQQDAKRARLEAQGIDVDDLLARGRALTAKHPRWGR